MSLFSSILSRVAAATHSTLRSPVEFTNCRTAMPAYCLFTKLSATPQLGAVVGAHDQPRPIVGDTEKPMLTALSIGNQNHSCLGLRSRPLENRQRQIMSCADICFEDLQFGFWRYGGFYTTTVCIHPCLHTPYLGFPLIYL